MDKVQFKVTHATRNTRKQGKWRGHGRIYIIRAGSGGAEAQSIELSTNLEVAGKDHGLPTLPSREQLFQGDEVGRGDAGEASAPLYQPPTQDAPLENGGEPFERREQEGAIRCLPAFDLVDSCFQILVLLTDQIGHPRQPRPDGRVDGLQAGKDLVADQVSQKLCRLIGDVFAVGNLIVVTVGQNDLTGDPKQRA